MGSRGEGGRWEGRGGAGKDQEKIMETEGFCSQSPLLYFKDSVTGSGVQHTLVYKIRMKPNSNQQTQNSKRLAHGCVLTCFILNCITCEYDFFFFKNFVKVELIYNVVLISAVWQSD